MAFSVLIIPVHLTPLILAKFHNPLAPQTHSHTFRGGISSTQGRRRRRDTYRPPRRRHHHHHQHTYTQFQSVRRRRRRIAPPPSTPKVVQQTLIIHPQRRTKLSSKRIARKFPLEYVVAVYASLLLLSVQLVA